MKKVNTKNFKKSLSKFKTGVTVVCVKDKELNELTVLPYIELLFLIHTTVIPVENLLSVFLKFLVFTFFIIFFAYKSSQPIYFF